MLTHLVRCTAFFLSRGLPEALSGTLFLGGAGSGFSKTLMFCITVQAGDWRLALAPGRALS